MGLRLKLELFNLRDLGTKLDMSFCTALVVLDPCDHHTRHGANDSNCIFEGQWSRDVGDYYLSSARCRLIQFEFWHKLTQDTMTLLTMGLLYCILSPSFYAGDFDRRGIMNTTKLTTEVTLVLFSLHACWNPPSTKYTVYQVRLNQYLTFLTEKGKTLRNGQHKGLLTITGRAVQFAWVWGERCKGNSVFYPGNIYV